MTGGFGSRHNRIIRALVEFDGKVYAATSNRRTGGEIHRTDKGDWEAWEKVVDRSFADLGNRWRPFRSLAVMNELLFAATGGVAQVWRSRDGINWDKVTAEGFGKGVWNFSVRAMEPFEGRLYAGTGAEWAGRAEVYRSVDGDAWEPVVGDNFRARSNNIVYALGVYNGHLYAGTCDLLRGAAVYRTSDGRSWEVVASGGFGHRGNLYICDFRVYQAKPLMGASLVATTGWNPAGAEVWIYDGQRWDLFAPKGFGKRRNIDLAAASEFASDFYVGTWKTWWRWSRDNGAELWRYDSRTSRWEAETVDGFGNPYNVGIRVIFPCGDALYASLRNCRTGAEIWKGVRP